MTFTLLVWLLYCVSMLAERLASAVGWRTQSPRDPFMLASVLEPWKSVWQLLQKVA